MKIGDSDHVRLVARETADGCKNFLKCTRCGVDEWVLGESPVKSWDALIERSKAFERQHLGCAELVMPPAPTTPAEWFAGDDTGVSSLTIYSVMTGQRVRHTGIPYDPDDFGRCHRLLRLFPEWRVRLGEVATRFPDWRGLVEAWGELEGLYEQCLASGDGAQLYLRMQAARGEVPHG